MRVVTTTVLVGLFVITASAAAPVDDVGAGSAQQAIVVFHDGVGDPAQTAAELASAHGAQLGFVYQHALEGFSATLSPRALAAIERDPRVAYVELDQLAHTAADTSTVPVPTGIDRINADQNANLDIDGSDDLRVKAVVAVIDTGIDFQHSDLNVNTTKSVDCSGGGPFSSSCSTGAGDDDNGHGTHVAGTIGALDDGPNFTGSTYTDVHVVGVAPGVEQWAVKVLRSDGSGYISWIVAGIDYVTANASVVDVANMSLGCECSSQAMDDAIAKSVAAGVTYAVAAGNSAADASTFSPANHPDVITVSALADFNGEPGGLAAPTCRTDEDDTLANFSNFGSLIEVTAPGVCILSAWNDGGYNIISGTSMASPHAAGGAALLAATDQTLSPSQIENILISNGNTTDWKDEVDGVAEPRVDVANQTVFKPATTGTDIGDIDKPPSVGMTNPADGSTVSGTISVTADASDDGTVSQVEFFVDGGSIGVDSDGSDGWSVSWNTTTVADGGHTVSAEATDDALQTATDSVSVTVDNVDDPPKVAITNPADGSTVSGTVIVTADASDDGTVSQVEFFVDGGSIGVDSDGSDGWSVSWNTTTVADGGHTVAASVTDDAFQTGTDSVSVTVDNSVSYVVDLAGSSINDGSSWTAVVTITVTDSSGSPLQGIDIAGTWSDGASGSGTCVTASDGACSVEQSGILKRVGSVIFTVDTVEGTTDFGGESSTTVSKP